MDAATRARVALPLRPRAAPALAALSALQPALRDRLRAAARPLPTRPRPTLSDAHESLARRVYTTVLAAVNRPLHRGTFRLDGRDHPYAVEPYNATWRNERTVEVTLLRDALQRHRGGRVLELGNVMAHYGHVGHDVVDRYEAAPGVHNVDILD